MYIAGLATLLQTEVFPTFSQSDFFGRKVQKNLWMSVGKTKRAGCPSDRNHSRAAASPSTQRKASSSPPSPSRGSTGPCVVPVAQDRGAGILHAGGSGERLLVRAASTRHAG